MHEHEDIARRIEVAAGAGYRVLRNRRAPARRATGFWRFGKYRHEW